MIIIFGQRSYGKVDRVPGVCYVITIFAHLNFIPLIPLRSYIVIEGTENGGEFRGKEITTNFKSLLAGYLRVWGGAVMIVAGLFAGFGVMDAVTALGLSDLLLAVVLGAGAGALLCLFVGGKFGAAVQAGVHIASLVLWYALQDAAGQNRRAAADLEGAFAALMVANVALLLFGLTRFFDHAGAARTRELLKELGVELPPEEDEDMETHEEKWEDWDASEDRRRRGG